MITFKNKEVCLNHASPQGIMRTRMFHVNSWWRHIDNDNGNNNNKIIMITVIILIFILIFL